MKYLLPLCALALLSACGDMPLGGGAGGSGAAVGAGGGYKEFLVLGSRMSFEQCRAGGGLIIRDNGSPMVACDPRVVGKVVPADEFDHPGSPASVPAS